MKTINRPLECDVVDGQLVIRIGIGTLAWASKQRNGGPLPKTVRVQDLAGWAEDVANELERSDEVGNTMLCELLDEAMTAAMDRGSGALAYKKP